LVIALVAALLGFTGVLHNSAEIVRFVFYVVAAFSGLSLLFALFEETGSQSKGRHHPVWR